VLTTKLIFFTNTTYRYKKGFNKQICCQAMCRHLFGRPSSDHCTFRRVV